MNIVRNPLAMTAGLERAGAKLTQNLALKAQLKEMASRNSNGAAADSILCSHTFNRGARLTIGLFFTNE